MAAIATIDIPRVYISTVELEHPDRPYTYETIETLSSFYGEQATLFFVMGSDSFEELHLWREPMRVLSKSNLIVAARPGYQMVNPSLLEIATGMGAGAGSSGEQARDQTKHSPVSIVDLRQQPAAPMSVGHDARNNIYLTEYVKRDISSTDIRQRVSEGLSVADLVPAQVAEYIGKYGLYRNVK